MIKRKSACTTMALPLQKPLTTYFGIEEDKCYNSSLTNQWLCDPQTRKPLQAEYFKPCK